MIDPAVVLARLRADGLLRELREVQSAQGARVRLDGREVVLLCSNDYLGLAGHPALRRAAAVAAERWGAGAGASRLVSGNMTPHAELEAALAAFKGYERALLFGSGFLANVGAITALADRGEVILSDELNHASIVDGCRQSRAETIVYPHADAEAVEHGLRRARGRSALIVTDAVFSMDGDLAPLAAIVELARRYGARVLVDEAHATGVIGPGGRGLVAELGLEGEVDVVIGTLGKALGSYGAFACCNRDLAALFVNRARTLIYSTALPPPSVAAAAAGLQELSTRPALVERLRANAYALRDELAACGCAVAPGQMPIVPLIMGDAGAAVRASEQILCEGMYVGAIRPPTVPTGTSRLRLVATAAHTEAELRDAARTVARHAAVTARA